ncbi:MAG: hypothetical protein IKE61_04320 [Coriobacteriales bacterium]|nr:hypothetical protein [Coriobacteriales bacterium]
MDDEKKEIVEAEEKAEKIAAPVSEICVNATENASAIDDDSEIEPVQGFFLTAQRWH